VFRVLASSQNSVACCLDFFFLCFFFFFFIRAYFVFGFGLSHLQVNK
jgi:hypothetical protein